MRYLDRRRGAARWAAVVGVSIAVLFIAVSFAPVSERDQPIPVRASNQSALALTELRHVAEAELLPLGLTETSVVHSFDARGVDGLASDKKTAVVDLFSGSEDQELAMFDEANNSSWVAQTEVPGGLSVDFIQLVSAGGEFYGAWLNLSSSAEIWERISLSGKVTTPKMPLRSTITWGFPYGNATRLFAAAPGFLVELNASSLKVVANYSAPIPTNVAILSAAPSGNRLYLGGYRLLSNNATNPYFGYLTLSSRKLTTITNSITPYPSTYLAAFYSVAAQGSSIYVGGDIEVFALYNTTIAYHTAQGLLYRFTPSDSTFQNMSSELPLQSWGVWSIVPWSKTIAFTIAGWGYNSSTRVSYVGDGIYTLSSSGSSLVNQSSLLPSSFLGGGFDASASSDGWFFIGGYDPQPYAPQVVAIKT